MYTVQVGIKGVTPLLQHKFSTAALAAMGNGAQKRSGSPDYSLEWLETCYRTTDGLLFQPATHIEGALVEAAKRYTVKGKRGATWRAPVQAYVYVTPLEIPHRWHGELVKAPGPELLTAPTDNMSVSVLRVKVQRAAVARSRLMLAPGWELAFTIEVHDEQVRPDVLQEILNEAGRAVGVGDYRPRYGRFEVTSFEVQGQ